MRIIFCGGGTAGHVTPAIAIAEHIKKLYPTAEILFIGREGGDENSTVVKSGFDIKTIKIKGIARSLSMENCKSLFIALASLKRAKKIINDFSPDVVVGTGGYVTWPIIKMAQSLKIPTVIHESNACPGLVTKLLSKKCDKVLLNLPGSENEFRKKDNLKTVGNPVREDFLKADRESSRKKLGISRKELLISSFGGSGGSEKLNNVIIEVMRKHSAKNRNIKHLHSCGRKYYRDIKEKFPDLTSGKYGCEIKAYVEDMATVMAASDIVISRCGAMTLCEICSVGTAAILIPSPNVTNNHQYKNAKLICDAGAAIMIEEDQLSADSLIAVLNELEAMPKRRAEISQKASAFYPENSKEIIAEEIIKLI